MKVSIAKVDTSIANLAADVKLSNGKVDSLSKEIAELGKKVEKLQVK
jgi:septal ring factor EnvC (AmiA/AmiB activator)